MTSKEMQTFFLAHPSQARLALLKARNWTAGSSLDAATTDDGEAGQEVVQRDKKSRVAWQYREAIWPKSSNPASRSFETVCPIGNFPP
ncbi:MAG: hypothetical protein V3R73_03775 [Sphingomonadales bacterium]